MVNLSKIKKHFSAINILLEESNINSQDIFLVKKKLDSVEKQISSLDNKILKSDKFIIDDNFQFIGYHKDDSKPLYKYIGKRYVRDIKSVSHPTELIFLKNNEVVSKSKLDLFPSNMNEIIMSELSKLDVKEEKKTKKSKKSSK